MELNNEIQKAVTAEKLKRKVMHNFLYIIVMALVDMAAIYDPKRGSKKSFLVTGDNVKAVIMFSIFICVFLVLRIVAHFTYFHLNLKGFKKLKMSEHLLHSIQKK